MIFVTGPLFAGKQECICRLLGWSEADFEVKAVRDVQDLVRENSSSGWDKESLVRLSEELGRHAVVIAAEVGAGVVPADAEERAFRERAGRLACLLAGQADTVIRVCCGLPQVLKGKMPEKQK